METIELQSSDLLNSLSRTEKIKDSLDIKKLSLSVDATNMCQLNCTYCYYGEKGCNMMNVENLEKSIINIADAIGSQLEQVNINYMGGEPLIGWNYIKILNEEVKKKLKLKNISFKWALTSNLISLNDEIKEVMIKEKAGIHCSVDGPDFIQNQNRPLKNGKESFSLMDKSIPLALEISPNDTARVTVTPMSAHHLIEITQYLIDKGFNTIGLFPAFNLEWNDADIEAWSIGLKKSFELVNSNNKKISTILKPKSAKEKFNFCGAGKSLWALDVNGGLYNCHRLTNYSQYKIIDAANSSVEEIRNAMIKKSLAPHSIDKPEKCNNCSAHDFCDGGCWSENLAANNTPYLPESMSCKFMQTTSNSIKEYLDMPKYSPTDCWALTIGPNICCMLACDGCDRCESCVGCEYCNTCDGCDTYCNVCDREQCYTDCG